MNQRVGDDIRQRLATSIQHLTRVCHGNDEFIKSCEADVEKAGRTASAIQHTDHARYLMVVNMADALKALITGVRAVDDKLKQKLIVCEALYSKLAESSHVIDSDTRTASELLEAITPADASWIPLISELIGSGHVGTLLDGIVVPFLRSSEVDAFRKLCE